MNLFKSVDKKFEEIGFVKIREDKYGVEYERYDRKFNYLQKLDILCKSNGERIVQSYDFTNTTSSYSPVVGLTAYEIKLALKKIKKLKTKNR